jgi:hypothetical protein
MPNWVSGPFYKKSTLSLQEKDCFKLIQIAIVDPSTSSEWPDIYPDLRLIKQSLHPEQLAIGHSKFKSVNNIYRYQKLLIMFNF